MANQTLRDLAKEHAQGNLDKETYRKSRAQLLQGIIASTIPVKEIDYPPPVQPPEPESLDDTQRKDDYKKAPAQNTNPEASTAPKASAATAKAANTDTASPSSNKLLFAGLGLAVVAIVVIAVLVLGTDRKSKPTAASTDSTTNKVSKNAGTIDSTTAADSLIREFLAGKNWSSQSLDSFQQRWQSLSEADRKASENSPMLGRLTNAIYKQLLEEQALSGLVDDDSSDNKQIQLVQFATALGIVDDRISLPDETASAMDAIDSVEAELDP